ncbi:transcription-repair coupling factor [Acholeplasma laidlawii]|uniref:transcription-repair coupling factor n=1 Tax=Acholeplasma laidlawii TaxID=2148 RepID=UPI0015AB8AEF|nr:transcription-repair coupling factor [Acholeplasma laidlawii]NWH12410.1 transcription-repair coupling factor [Acholeplasma laidlawii]
MTKNLLNSIYKDAAILNARTGDFKGVSHSYLQTMLSLRYDISNKNIFVVLPNLYEAQKYYDTLSSIIDESKVLFYPMDQTLTSMMALGSPEFKNERLFTLRKLLQADDKYIIITTQEGILHRQLKPEDYERSVKKISVNQDYDLTDLTKKLIYDGYQFNYTVERPGEFSIRGSILDIYTHDYKDPYRLDFFGDTLESIKTFDVQTQKSMNHITSIDIAPLNELFYTDELKEQALEKISKYFSGFKLSEKEDKKLETDLMHIEERKRMDSLSMYIEFFNDEVTTILDFSNPYDLILVDSYKMELNEETTYQDLLTYSHTMQGEAFIGLNFKVKLKELLKKNHLSFQIYSVSDKPSTDLGVLDVDPFVGHLEQLILFINEYNGFNILISTKTMVSFERIKEHLTNHKISYSVNQFKDAMVVLVEEDLPGSFIDLNHKFIILTEDTILDTKKKAKVRYRSVINQAVKIRDISELQNGDYVVHYDFGIGQYIGLKTMTLSGDKRDYLHIVYDKDEALYVPTDQIDLVLKYKSYDQVKPKLSKLNAKQWSKTKAQVKQKIKDLSDRLLNLYAKRHQAEGYQFSPRTDMLTSFEKDFNYDETIDQQKAIDAVFEDMESSKPMDRLIAGDVGYGKTEVALRAAFKAVVDAKQVAYLVPTTVLARQHYLTFKDRFEKYGGSVALLSRYVSKMEQKEVLEKIAKGYIDVVIGTHRLLSDDIVFKDLGLFIIDEEQRFGVQHKEKIKEIKVNVDTLTLSATPIPRTLQMAMYGLKDLSMIDTPPLNRYPVQTYVVERQPALIKEAIDRELSRGGQVFYLFNNTERMEAQVLKLQQLVPNARITYAHGKMTKNRIEDTLSRFVEKEFDILVSTTIIETGVDIPNTNTLIIHDADHLGLAQLYQLRGRVGRSDRIAYAYLMFDGYKDVNDEAKKRLSVIEDFTDLGSGFKIALRDLGIRGAGDILGEEQSGFIDSVGMDLYMKLLDEVMTGKAYESPKTDTVDQVFSKRHIPPTYINHDPVRIEIHKRIASLNKMQDLEDLKQELLDRFGPIDIDLMTYMYEKLYKKLGHQVGIEKTVHEKDFVKMVISLEKSELIDGMRLLYVASKSKMNIRLGQSRGHVEINMSTKHETKHWLYLACELLEMYIDSKEITINE